jgi:hypothetical protein
MRRGAVIAWLGALLAAGPGFGADAPAAPKSKAGDPPAVLKGKITLRNKQEWDVELVGRRAREWVSTRKPDNPGVADLAVADIAGIEFVVAFNEAEIDDLYISRKFAEVVQKLEPFLLDAHRYLDIPNNLQRHVMTLLNARFFAGQIEPCMALADDIMRRAPGTPFHDKAALLKAAALLDQQKFKEAEALVKAVAKPARGSELSGIYWYCTAGCSLMSRRIMDAEDAAARLVAYAPGDFDWMPAGLYFTVVTYVDKERGDVAKQIVREMETAFSGSRWTEKAAALVVTLSAVDASGHGLDGLYKWNPRKGVPGARPGSGTAVELNGLIQHVTFRKGLDFIGEPHRSFTISLWVKADAHGPAIARGDPASEELGDQGFILGTEVFQLNGRGVAKRRTLACPPGLLGTWSHLAAVRDAAQAEVRLYVNGKRTGSARLESAVDFSTTNNVLAAGLQITPSKGGESQRYLKGQLDDIQIYDAPLSDEDVTFLYDHAGTPHTYTRDKVDIDFADDGKEYPAGALSGTIEGAEGLDRINAVYRSNPVHNFFTEFGGFRPSLRGAGEGARILEVDAVEDLGELLFWLNRIDEGPSFSLATIDLDSPPPGEHLAIDAFDQPIPRGGVLRNASSVAKKVVSTSEASGGRLSLALELKVPMRAVAVYYCDAEGQRVVDRNMPSIKIRSVRLESTGTPLAHFKLDELDVAPPKPAEAPEAQPKADAADAK